MMQVLIYIIDCLSLQYSLHLEKNCMLHYVSSFLVLVTCIDGAGCFTQEELQAMGISLRQK